MTSRTPFSALSSKLFLACCSSCCCSGSGQGGVNSRVTKRPESNAIRTGNLRTSIRRSTIFTRVRQIHSPDSFYYKKFMDFMRSYHNDVAEQSFKMTVVRSPPAPASSPASSSAPSTPRPVDVERWRRGRVADPQLPRRHRATACGGGRRRRLGHLPQPRAHVRGPTCTGVNNHDCSFIHSYSFIHIHSFNLYYGANALRKT